MQRLFFLATVWVIKIKQSLRPRMNQIMPYNSTAAALNKVDISLFEGMMNAVNSAIESAKSAMEAVKIAMGLVKGDFDGYNGDFCSVKIAMRLLKGDLEAVKGSVNGINYPEINNNIKN